jgi:hypothetical protein
MSPLGRMLLVAIPTLILVSCGAGTYLTKPGATLKTYLDDKSACQRQIANQPAPSATRHGATFSTPPFMDPQIYNCMRSKGWRHTAI